MSMADGKVVIDVILDDGEVVKGVADIDGTLGKIGDTGKRASKGILEIASALGLVAVAKKGIDLIRDSIQSAFGRIDTMEQFQRVMGVMVDDTDAVGRSMERMEDFLIGTSMRMDTMANSVQGFVTRGTEIDKATDYVEAWGNAISFYGDGSSEQFENVSDALHNMVSKGTVGMDQLNRITQAGIPAVELYADATGMASEDVQDALSSGEIAAEDFVDVVSTAMMEGTEKFPEISTAMKDEGASWSSIMSNIGAYVDIGITDIINSIDKLLTDNSLPDMRTMVDETAQAFGRSLSWVADTVIPKVGDAIGFVKGLFDDWMPVIEGVLDAFNPLKETLMESSEVLISQFSPVWESVKGLFESLLPIIQDIAMIVGGVLVSALVVLTSVANGVVQAIGPLVNAFINLIDVVVNVVNAIISVLKGDFSEALDYWNNATESAIEFFKSLWDGVVGFIKGFVDAIVGWFKSLYNILVGNSIIPDMVNAIVDWFKDMFQWVSDVVSDIVDAVTRAFEKAKDVIGATMEAAKDIIKAVWSYIEDTFKNALDFLLALVKGDFEGMKDAIQNQMENAQDLLENIWNAIDSFLSNILGDIWTNIKSRFSDIKNIIQSRITEAKNALVNRFNEMVSTTISKASEIVSTARQKFEEVKTAIRNKLTEAVRVVSQKVGEMPGKVREKVSNMLGAGRDLINGLTEGIKEKAKDAVDAVKGVVEDAIQGAKNLLGIESPSRVFMDIGEDTIKGYELGIKKRQHHADKEITELFKRVIKTTEKANKKQLDEIDKNNKEIKKIEERANEDIYLIEKKAKEAKRKLTEAEAIRIRRIEEDSAKKIHDLQDKNNKIQREVAEKQSAELLKIAEQYVEAKRRNGEMSLQDEVYFWNAMYRNAEKGSEQYELGLKNHQDAVKRLRSEIESINKEYNDRILEINEEYNKESQRLHDEYEKAYDDHLDKMLNFAGLFDEFKRNTEVTGKDLIANLKAQNEALEDYDTVINELGKRIDDDGLMQELKGMGVKAVGELQALNSLSDEELENYAQLYQEKFKLAKYHTDEEMQPMMEEIDEKLINLKEDTSQRLEEVNKEWQKKIKQIVKSADKEFDSMHQVGIDAMKGLSYGMESMRGSLISQAQSIASDIQSTIQSAFDIHSPSRWMRDMIGKNMMLGWMQGIDSERMAMIRKANEMTDWMKPNTPVVNRLRGVTAPISNVGLTGSSVTNSNSTTNHNSRSYAPTINNYFTKDESTPSEVARKNRQQQQRLAMEWGYR